MNYKFLSILIAFQLLALTACKAPVQEELPDRMSEYKESFLEANKYMRERNRDHMLAFAERRGWNMKESSTGLLYMIMEEGKGPAVELDKHITYTYETRLLDGTLCYAADTISPKKIVVGKGNIEAGLEEALLLLHENSHARFLIPPYLAHGNFGDMNKIPASAVLLVELKILDVKR